MSHDSFYLNTVVHHQDLLISSMSKPAWAVNVKHACQLVLLLWREHLRLFFEDEELVDVQSIFDHFEVIVLNF